MAEKLQVKDSDLPYPHEVLKRGVEGSAFVQCTLDEQGAVGGCTSKPTGIAFGGPSVDLGPELVRYLQSRRYTPVTLGGKPAQTAYAFEVTVQTTPKSQLGQRSAALELLALRKALKQFPNGELASWESKEVCVLDEGHALKREAVARLGRTIRLSNSDEGRDCQGRLYVALGRPLRSAGGDAFVFVTAGGRGGGGVFLTLASDASLTDLAVKSRSEFVE